MSQWYRTARADVVTAGSRPTARPSVCAQVEQNCTMIRWFREADILRDPDRRGAPVDAVAIYAARDLMPGEELFMSYGASYGKRRTWDAAPAVHIRKSEVQPPCLLFSALPPDAWARV